MVVTVTGMLLGAWCAYHSFQLVNAKEIRHPLLVIVCAFAGTLIMTIFLSPKIQETIAFTSFDSKPGQTLVGIVRVQRGKSFFSPAVFVKSSPTGREVRVPIADTAYTLLVRSSQVSRFCIGLKTETGRNGAVRAYIPDTAIKAADLRYCGYML